MPFALNIGYGILISVHQKASMIAIMDYLLCMFPSKYMRLAFLGAKSFDFPRKSHLFPRQRTAAYYKSFHWWHVRHIHVFDMETAFKMSHRSRWGKYTSKEHRFFSTMGILNAIAWLTCQEKYNKQVCAHLIMNIIGHNNQEKFHRNTWQGFS